LDGLIDSGTDRRISEASGVMESCRQSFLGRYCRVHHGIVLDYIRGHCSEQLAESCFFHSQAVLEIVGIVILQLAQKSHPSTDPFFAATTCTRIFSVSVFYSTLLQLLRLAQPQLPSVFVLSPCCGISTGSFCSHYFLFCSSMSMDFFKYRRNNKR
jgi:hypothetical protein